MSNNQLYPFQRNRYYSGKLLTSADFQAEQDYFNSKERFLSSLMYGSGVVCGLGVVSLDDLSILVESGVAIDGLGREVILESSVVKKLSAVEGYDTLETNKAALCIKYHEEPVHSVYAVGKGQGDQEYEYARIAEASKLFLIDKEKCQKVIDFQTEFLASNTLYQDSDFMVEVRIPSTVSKGHNARLELVVKKISDADSSLTLHAVLQVPGFLTADNLKEIELEVDELSLPYGEEYIIEKWLKVPVQESDDTLIILKSGSARAYIDNAAVNMPTDFEMKILLSDVHPRKLVNREIGRMSLEMRDMGGVDEYICIAEIDLIRTDNSYVIDKIYETEVKKYVAAPAQSLIRAGYLDYYFKATELAAKDDEKKATEPERERITNVTGGPEIATGILEIPLGNDTRKGDVRFSGEIMHGLGSGNVYVQIGFESVNEDSLLGANVRSTIYGNADLFRADSMQAPLVDTAVKVLDDKGSFVVAAKLLENVDYLVLTYRWVAIKFPMGDEAVMEEDISDKNIIPETPTVVLGTRESHFFGVRLENMDKCSIVYEVTEEGCGEITSDGIYTAPNKEGVFEIRIYCAEKPMICAYAYAIVKKQVENEVPVQ